MNRAASFKPCLTSNEKTMFSEQIARLRNKLFSSMLIGLLCLAASPIAFASTAEQTVAGWVSALSATI